MDKYYYVVCVDGKIRQVIDTTGTPNRYGKPKIFKSKKEAQKWIDKKTYSYMSYHYEIKETERKLPNA